MTPQPTAAEYLQVVRNNLDTYETRLTTSGNMSAAMKSYIANKRHDLENQLSKLNPERKPFKGTLF